MEQINGMITIKTIKPGPIIRIEIQDTVSEELICMFEMQPEEFALALTSGGPQRGKYLNIYHRIDTETA